MSEPKRARFNSVGALAAWRARAIRDPESGRMTDALLLAACLEIAGDDAWRAGLDGVAEAYFKRAAELLVAAAKQTVV